jgi:hypothetical protein
MSTRDLNRAVARATGESVDTIDRQGFHLLGDSPTDDPGPLVMDWDDVRPAYLRDVVSDDDWPGRIEPLASWDEEFQDELAEEAVGAAA